MKAGIGFDVHRLTEKRPLILGGVNIKHEKGLSGHSDADVLIHAVMDAILGALGEGDIGIHFPDTDPAYKGVSSIELLKKVSKILNKKGFKIVNVDSVIIAQKPKVSRYFRQMEENIAKALDTEESNINVKATTTEGLGFCGNEEGIAAKAIATIEQ